MSNFFLFYRFPALAWSLCCTSFIKEYIRFSKEVSKNILSTRFYFFPQSRVHPPFTWPLCNVVWPAGTESERPHVAWSRVQRGLTPRLLLFVMNAIDQWANETASNSSKSILFFHKYDTIMSKSNIVNRISTIFFICHKYERIMSTGDVATKASTLFLLS